MHQRAPRMQPCQPCWLSPAVQRCCEVRQKNKINGLRRGCTPSSVNKSRAKVLKWPNRPRVEEGALAPFGARGAIHTIGASGRRVAERAAKLDARPPVSARTRCATVGPAISVVSTPMAVVVEAVVVAATNARHIFGSGSQSHPPLKRPPTSCHRP
jgi:hypothetical protein